VRFSQALFSHRLSRRLLAALGIILLVCGAFLLIAQDEETLRVRSELAAGDPAFPDYVASLVGTAATNGDRYVALTNGDQIFPPMLASIRSARRRISFETYIYDRGDLADRFTSELTAAARRGVVVRILIDALGSQQIGAETIDRLRNGCHVARFNPVHWYSLHRINYRTHRKILVVDGEIGFTGGAGVAEYWTGNAQDAEHWRESHIEVRGPAVRYLEAAFYQNWLKAAGQATPALDPPPPAAGGARSVVTWSSPEGGSSSVKMLYLLTIAAARRTLDIQSPYFITDESTAWALDEAVRRGVRVRVLVEGDITDAKAVKFASRALYERMLRQGIAIHEYVPTMMHAKAVIADDTWSIVGSANFDNRSLELNDELNVGVADADLARQLTAQFEADLRRTRRLDLEAWRNRPRLERAREVFWSYFSEVF